MIIIPITVTLWITKPLTCSTVHMIHVITTILLSYAERIAHFMENRISLFVVIPVIGQELESVDPGRSKAAALLPSAKKNIALRLILLCIGDALIMIIRSCYLCIRHLHSHHPHIHLDIFVPCKLRCIQNLIHIL